MSIAQGQLTSLAFCWRLERRDGAGLALTSHDRPLMIGGIKHEPEPGMTPAAVRAELGLDPRSSEISGSLSCRAISEADLTAGRWDGASLRLAAIDWEAPEAGEIDCLGGDLGQVASSGGRFEADLLGLAARLEKPICPVTTPECRAELGDPQCRVDMAARKMRARVIGSAGHLLTVDQVIEDRFRFGRLRFLGGAANGESRTILSIDGHELSLRSAPAGDVEAGTAVELREGCDKRLVTCAERFANSVNFRGEPHLPGNDLLTRYPGA